MMKRTNSSAAFLFLFPYVLHENGTNIFQLFLYLIYAAFWPRILQNLPNILNIYEKLYTI